MQRLRGIATNTHMMSHETVALERKLLILVVKRRKKQRIAHSHSPMLPTGIKIMVVVVVLPAYFVGNR